MNANKITLEAVLARDCQYIAPLFQRPYVWNEEQNWVPLWDAVQECTERRLKGDPRTYFLGALVLDQLNHPAGTVSKREIIDGQQRLTTLQIFMQAAREEAQRRGFDHSERQLMRMTSNDLEDETDEHYKVWPTNIDRDEFRQVMRGDPSSGLLGRAKAFFTEKVAELLGRDLEVSQERARCLVACLKNDFVFVAIDLENDDDGQLIFETLNSLGTPLLPSDLVKNLLFREAASEGLNTESLYAEYWKAFEDDSDYWRGNLSSGRRLRTKLDMFLQSYLVLKIGREPAASHLFKEFRSCFRDGKLGTTKEAMKEFSELSLEFKAFFEVRSGTPFADFRDVLEVLDLTTAYPLVLGIRKFVSQPEEQARMLVAVESFLMRRFLCGMTTKSYNKLFGEMVSALNDGGWTGDVLAAHLLASDSPSAVWPEDEQLKQRQVERQAYRELRGVGIAYALSRVERRRRSPTAEEGWNTRTPLTLEHILPRSWEANWPLEDESSRILREECINRIGNLTVLTQKLNNEVSNKGWSEKREAIRKTSVLRVNLDLAEEEFWNEDTIMNRCRTLGEEFCQIWPRESGD